MARQGDQIPTAAVLGIAAPILLGLVLSCGGERAAPVHHLVFGGDVLLGNKLNSALYDEARRKRVFGDLAPIFRGADIAYVNAEGVIARGGDFFDKGDPVPHCFRAHPFAVETLRDAGIDVVSVGNNHVGDYGPQAFVEMLDRLAAAGIAYTGGGNDAADALRPAYLRVEDTVVALVGANMTSAGTVRAEGARPGNLFFPDPAEQGAEETEAALVGLLKEARRHAQIVLLTPHWGAGWREDTGPAVRKLAKRLIHAGYDGILGHSSHRIHGAEVIDGKPVLYDTGNLTVYWTNDADRSNQGLVFDIAFERRGITGVLAHPVRLTENETNLARGKLKDDILKRFADRSSQLGTAVDIENGVARVACDPGEAAGPETASDPPRRPKPERVREAPRTFLAAALPPDARPLDVAFENGVRLVGARIEPAAIPRRQPSLLVTLYWIAPGPIAASREIRLEARGLDRLGRPKTEEFNHLPGDWMLPMNEWPAGAIVRDRTILRLGLKKEGAVEVRAGIVGVRATAVDGAPAAEDVVSLGTIPFVSEGPGLLEALRRTGGTP